MFTSLRWRIAVPFMLLFLLSMGGLGFYLLNFFENSYRSDIQNKLNAEAELLAESLATQPAVMTQPNQAENSAQRWASLLNARVTIISADGKVIGESQINPASLENHLQRPEIQQALASGLGTSIRYSNSLGVDMMYVAAPVKINGQIVGFARVALALSSVQSRITDVKLALISVTLLVTVLTLLLALYIAGRTATPLHRLTQAAQKLASGSVEQAESPSSYTEVHQLEMAFKIMSVQLDERIRALKSESSKLSTVLHEMDDGVLLVDEEGRVRLINQAAERMFGKAESGALGHPAAEVLRYYQFVELWQACRKSGETQHASVEIGKARLSLQGVATPLGDAMPGSILLIFQDLSQIRRLEMVRRDFLSNISHELRTPLASLKALTETLKEGAIDDPPAAHHFLESMDKELDALAHMVSELLELTRIESGQVPLQLKPVPPAGLMREAAERLIVQAERVGLALEIECPPDLPDVLADPPRMEQVLVNILHNAIKFTPAGGKVTLSALRDGKMVVFSIHDTGVGISADDLPRIFERFYKVDKSRSKGGTGLGLAIARHLVEGHGGRIWVESVEGQGSTFSLTLPVV